MVSFLPILLAFIVLFVFFKLLNSSTPTANWSHLFVEMNQDPVSFYELVEEILVSREVPDIKTSRKHFKEGNFLSHTRLYLEVSRGDLIFHICTAPWGTSCFFSIWTRKKANTLDDLLAKLPLIGNFFAQINQYDSYYKLDTDTMFRKSVHQSVIAAIDLLTETRGIRGLTELEKIPEKLTIMKRL